MPYTTPTLTEATTALASRLNDPSNIRWTLVELQAYVREALRTWSVWTSHWRDTGNVFTVVNQAIYDLSVELPALRGHDLTNWDLVTDLQIALLEPPAAGGTWTGTDQFTLQQLTDAIQRRRDQFLRDTGVIQTRAEILYQPGDPALGVRLGLPEAILDVRRAAWRTAVTGTQFPLIRTDEWAANNFQPAWNTSTKPPTAYSVTATPPLFLQMIPPYVFEGTLDLITINKGSTVDPAVATSLGIPDDYGWVVKYGALADLLSGDGLALDPQRAAYCEARWQQGIDHIRRNPVVLTARINNAPVTIGAIADADRYSPTWQLVSGVPKRVLLAGHNLIASWPPPGLTGGPWTITLDVVTNVVVPILGVDILPISADVYDSILDLAQHTALFKEGPGQTEQAMALLERAGRAGGIDLQLQQAQQPSRSPITKQTIQDVSGPVPDQLPAIPA